MSVIFFVTSFLSIMVCLLLIAAILFRRPSRMLSKAELEAAFFRDQLRQVEKDINLNLVEKRDGEYIKSNLSTKILNRIKQKEKVDQNTGSLKLNSAIFLVVCVFISVVTITTYLNVGNVQFLENSLIKIGGVDVNKRNFLAQETIEGMLNNSDFDENKGLELTADSELIDLIKKLKNVLEKRPSDLNGHQLLVDHSFKIGDYVGARKAQSKVLKILGSQATSSDFSKYAKLCFQAGSGYISIDALNAIKMAMDLNPTNPEGHFFSSLALLQEKKYVGTYELWIDLIKNEKENSKWVELITKRILLFIGESEILMPFEEKSITGEKNQHLVFLMPVLEAWEERLGIYKGSIEEWQNLINVYESFHHTEKASNVRQKARNIFKLSDF